MVKHAILSKVTIDGRPFCAIEDTSSSILKMAMKSLDMNYDRKNVSDLVGEAASFIKEKLQSDLKQSLICVKLDCATRHRRSFIGVNIQVIK